MREMTEMIEGETMIGIRSTREEDKDKEMIIMIEEDTDKEIRTMIGQDTDKEMRNMIDEGTDKTIKRITGKPSTIPKIPTKSILLLTQTKL